MVHWHAGKRALLQLAMLVKSRDEDSPDTKNSHLSAPREVESLRQAEGARILRPPKHWRHYFGSPDSVARLAAISCIA